MSRTRRTLVISLALCSTAFAVAGAWANSTGEIAPPPPSPSESPRLDGSATRAIAFAARLAELGPRPAASAGEARARAAVIAELEAIGLEVSIEPFEYSTFRIEAVTLDLGGTPVAPVILGLNPFSEQLEFTGEAMVITDPDEAASSMAGRIVVTSHPLMQLMIAEHDPAVVICVQPEDLDAFVARGRPEVSLSIEGAPVVLQSANIVARFGPPQAGEPEILVTSHIDAYQDSPGANDNGTGLGVMIELARAFAARVEGLGRHLTFVAFGAEENGAIGSRAYVEAHLAELTDVIAVVNLDTLGGARGPVVGTSPSGPAGPAVEIQNRVPVELRGRAWEGPDGGWRMIHPQILTTAFTSNYPAWLEEIVADSATDCGIEVAHLDLISDHRTFALAGLPAISIQSKEHRIHSAQDTADALVPETVTAGARLATAILRRLLVDSSGRPFTPSAGRPN